MKVPSLLFASEASNYKHFELRSWSNFVNHIKIELRMAAHDWKILLPCLAMQYIHAIFHNWAYYVQGNVLSLEKRFPLHDLGFELMPEITGSANHASEYLVFGVFFGPGIILFLSILLFKQNPHRPRFIAIIIKRALLLASIALVFRITSFMITTLPASAAHCRLNFDASCQAQNPNDPLKCVIPNPDFKPPKVSEFFTKLDAISGCGDLMFSSHTIYTLMFLLTISKYWPHLLLVGTMVCTQIAVAFLIVASRKHYSLDVFTALYVVPMIWFILEAYKHDINHKDIVLTPKSVQEFYGIDVSSSNDSETDYGASIQLDSARVSMLESVGIHELRLSGQPTTPTVQH